MLGLGDVRGWIVAVLLLLGRANIKFVFPTVMIHVVHPLVVVLQSAPRDLGAIRDPCTKIIFFLHAVYSSSIRWRFVVRSRDPLSYGRRVTIPCVYHLRLLQWSCSTDSRCGCSPL